ncbi:DUF1801 domain-containing protein [Owenweeksia hongkongensis]|uniref:DUF1801 domain-containing protein n=1 Tax=Owenweeksia hongkongensis TaxID=253245 RepID=UPI003A8CB7ED
MSRQEIDNFYLNLTEPNRGCMLSLRDIISNYHPDITQEWKYRLPFFYLKGKMFCYLWVDKKTTHPYIGFTDGGKMEHPSLIQGDRKRMKILLIDPNNDIPLNLLKEILNEALALRS